MLGVFCFAPQCVIAKPLILSLVSKSYLSLFPKKCERRLLRDDWALHPKKFSINFWRVRCLFFYKAAGSLCASIISLHAAYIHLFPPLLFKLGNRWKHTPLDIPTLNSVLLCAHTKIDHGKLSNRKTHWNTLLCLTNLSGGGRNGNVFGLRFQQTNNSDLCGVSSIARVLIKATCSFNQRLKHIPYDW